MPATRDNKFRRTRAGAALQGAAAAGVVNASGGSGSMRRLMSGCVLLLCVALANACGANAPSTVNTTAASTPVTSVSPLTGQRSGEVRANAQASPGATTGAGNSILEATPETTKGAPGVAVPAQAANAASSVQESGGEASAAYEGFYEVLGTRPKGFEQFGNFMIRAPKNGRISGAVVPLEGEIFEFARATLDGRKLSFVTQKIGSVHYSFDGQFLAAPPFASNKKAAVAEGLVKKFRGEKLAAEAALKFYFDEGGEDP